MNKKNTTIIIKLVFFLFMLIAAYPALSQSVEEQYSSTISRADSYFSKADYLNAKASYQIAAQLKPDEQYPKDRLRESIDLLRIQMEEMAVYNDKVAFADQLYKDGSFDKAISAYQEALKMMPSQEYPTSQIKLIREKQAIEAENEARYNRFLTEGDQLFNTEKLKDARKKYEEAVNVYPDRKEAKEKIQAVDQRMAEITAQQSGYQKALSEAEMYHARKDYEKELLSYQKASELKPEEAFPQIKIRELNDFLKKYEAYNNFVAQADDLYIGQQYAEARVLYEKALEVLPGESYPKEIISKINIALAEKSERNKAAYEEAIAKADALYNEEDYDAAMLAYSEALRFWPEGEHARKRIGSIAEIRALQKAQEEAYANTISLADKLFADKNYGQARDEYKTANEIKPFEQYPKVRLNEIDMILAELQSKIEQYENIIQGADKLFNVGDYQQARIQYLKAQELLSDRSYPVDQIKMIDEILGLQKATREDYLAAIARGDEHFARREWEDAKVDYVTANDLIPEEEYPDEKITEINNILAMLKAEQETYTLALKNADQLFADKDYNGALLEYRRAADIFSEEEYPRMKIEEINGILADLETAQALEENYSAAIASADDLMARESYAEASTAYEKAASLKPTEQYPRDKIAEIKGILKEQARIRGIEESYMQALETGNTLFGEGRYAEAKIEYQRALEFKPGETEPAERIAEINTLLAEQERQAEINAAYTAKISSADALFAEGNYSEARVAYVEAAEIKAAESYPAEKIAEIDIILASAAAEAERLAQLAAQFEQLVSDADAMLAQENYEGAKGKFQEALTLKPNEQYPRARIDEIDGLLAEIAAVRVLNESYTAAISEADGLLSAKKYTEARAVYDRASSIKPDEQYPKDKIIELDGILEELARQRGIEENYAAAMEAADIFFEQEKYAEARIEYQRALDIKPGETLPAEKISQIDSILAELQRQQGINDAYAAAIANADKIMAEGSYAEAIVAYRQAAVIKPSETYPPQKIAEAEAAIRDIELMNEKYADGIDKGDAYLAQQKYTEARAEFQKASELKPEETYPSEKIAEIEAILAKLEEKRLIDEDYTNIITAGDNFFNEGKFLEARAVYQQAGALKPSEAYPSERIVQIDGILTEQKRIADLEAAYDSTLALADKQFTDASYAEAIDIYRVALTMKPQEEYPLKKIAEAEAAIRENERIAALNEQYSIAIGTADTYFDSKQYEEARQAYERALGLKPDATYPAGRISEIDNMLLAMEQQRIIEEGYANALARGDNLFTNKEYAEARAEYEKALGFKAAEQYPSEKIAEIDGILNEQARLLALEAAYGQAIGQADAFLAGKQYDEAKLAYQKALESKPDDGYAMSKITEIDGMLDEMAMLKQLEENYTREISKADEAFASARYEEARNAYGNAINLKPGEQYPAGRIAEIDGILAELARKQGQQRRYDQAIAAGDSLLQLKDYSRSRTYYLQAIELIPEQNAYPEEKITEIDATLQEIARLETIRKNYNDAIAEADGFLGRSSYLEALQAYEKAAGIKPDETYPREKISEINAKLSEMAEERQKAYDAAIVQADNYFDLGNFRSAKSAYETAVGIKPDEQYARNRLDEATKLYLAEVEALKVDYRKFIADADNYFKNKIYDGAIENYRLASAILPDEEYPGKMILRITKIINDNAITDVNRLAQVIPDNTERKFSFSPLPVSVRKENYILIKARNLTDHDFKMLVNFGQDNSKSGGVVLQVPKGEEVRDYIIRIGALYKWFSDDNNWLSIYPEGGDIEVSLVRVSKSD